MLAAPHSAAALGVAPKTNRHREQQQAAASALLGLNDPTTGLRDELSLCWGSALTGSACCSPEFRPRAGHFKNKMCPECLGDNLIIELQRVRALPESMKAVFANSSSSGLWSQMELNGVAFEYRLINHTAKCIGPALVILFAPLLPEEDACIAWEPLPRAWLHSDGSHAMKFIFAKGTLCPALSMRRAAAGQAIRAASAPSAAMPQVQPALPQLPIPPGMGEKYEAVQNVPGVYGVIGPTCAVYTGAQYAGAQMLFVPHTVNTAAAIAAATPHGFAAVPSWVPGNTPTDARFSAPAYSAPYGGDHVRETEEESGHDDVYAPAAQATAQVLRSMPLVPGAAGAEANSDGDGGEEGTAAETQDEDAGGGEGEGEDEDEDEGEDEDEDALAQFPVHEGEPSAGTSSSATPSNVVNLADLLSAHEHLSGLIEAHIQHVAQGGGGPGGSFAHAAPLSSVLSSLVQPLRTSADLLRVCAHWRRLAH